MADLQFVISAVDNATEALSEIEAQLTEMCERADMRDEHGYDDHPLTDS